MAKKIELLHTTYDESGNIESQEVVHPLTSPNCIIMENGKTLDEVMGDGIATPTLTHEGTSFKVGVGDSNIEVVDGDVAGMTLKGQSYQNILPKPTTLIMETDEQEFKINDKIDSNIIIDDNIAEIATVKGKTIVNAVQEESSSEYTVLGEDLSGQSITHTKDYLVNLIKKNSEEKHSDDLAYDFDVLNVRPNTTYTVIFNGSFSSTYAYVGFVGEGWSSSTRNWSNGTAKLTLTPTKETTKLRIRVDSGTITVSNVMVFEGDYTTTNITNMNIEYFEDVVGNIKGVTLQGQTLVNTIQEPCKDDYVVLGADDGIEISAETGGHGTIEDTVQGGLNGAVLEGMTLVNTISNVYDLCNLPVSQEVSMSSEDTTWNSETYRIKAITFTKNMLPNVTYLIKLEVTELTGTDKLGSYVVDTDGNMTYSIANGVLGENNFIYTPTAKIQKIAFYLDDIAGKTASIKEPMVIEYQQGMENWDIPYFESIQSVQMPVLTTVGKNLNTGTLVLGKIEDNGEVNEWVSSMCYNPDYIEIMSNTEYGIKWIKEVNNMRVFFYDCKRQFIGKSDLIISSGGTFITPSNCKYIRFHLGVAHDGWQNYEVAIHKGNIIPTSYEPYQSSTVTTEKNLFDGMLTPDYLTDSTGQPSGRSDGTVHCHTPSFIPIQANEKFRLRATSNGSTTVGDGRVYFYDKDYNYLNIYVTSLEVYTNTFSMDVIHTVPNNSNIAYMRVRFFNGLGVQANSVQINKVYELRGIGDVKDELDLTTGKLTQRIGEKALYNMQCYFTDTSFDGETTYLIDFGKATDYMIPDDVSNKLITNFTKAGNIYYACETEGIRYDGWGLYLRIKKDRLTEKSIDALKKYLTSVNATIQYIMKEPIVKTIDLQVTDQDGNIIPHIQAQPTVTHITTSSDYLIPTVTIDNNLAYDTIIKPSTLYTVRFKHDTVNADNPLTVDLGGTVQEVTSTEFTITTPSELTHNQLVFSGKNNVVSEVQVIEGDVTNIEYPFFEGMNDVKFSDSKFIGRGKNLFDMNAIVKDDFELNKYQYAYYGKEFVLQPNTTYIIKPYLREEITSTSVWTVFNIINKNSVLEVINVDRTGTAVKNIVGTMTFTTDSTGKVGYSIYAHLNSEVSWLGNLPFNIQLEEGSTATPYEPYKGVEVQQDVDSIPLTSDMFEQGKRERGLGMSMQQCPLISNPARISSKTLIPVKPNGKYVVQGITSANHIWGDMYDKDGLLCYDNVYGLVNAVIPHDVHYLVVQVKNADESAITPSDLDSMNLILQEVPQEIVLRGIGDVKDELDLTRGEYIQRIGEMVLDGDDSNLVDKYIIAGNNKTYVTLRLPNARTNVNYAKWHNELLKNEYLGASATQSQPLAFALTGDTTIRFTFFGGSNKTDLKQEKEMLKKYPITIQYILATPIIHKVNLTNTKVIQSYATETHYETITPSDSLIPNITIPSTLNYDVAIKPSTEYTIRANTSDNLTVDLGGTTGTLSNGKVTLTTPVTLTHNEVKFSGTGKVKELMVVEGNEIKDNVPFFNGMKDVQMGGIKLVNIARGATVNSLVTANTNKTQFTYTSNGTNWGDILFDKSLLKQNTLYTIYLNVISSNSDNANPIKISMGDDLNTWLNISSTGLFKQTFATNDNIENLFGINFRPCTSGQQVVIENPMVIEGDWTHLDEIPYIESEMIIDQPIIRSQGKNLLDLESKPFTIASAGTTFTKSGNTYTVTTTLANSTPYDYIRRVWTVNNDKWLRDVAGKKLTLSVSSISCTNSNSMACIQLRIECMDGTKYYPGIHNSGKAVTFNMPINVKNLQMQVMTNNTGAVLTEDAVLTIGNIQLELGDTATSYEPFKHQTLYSNRVIGYEEGIHYGGITGIKSFNPGFNSVMADVEGLSIAYVTNGSSNFSFWDKDMVFISGKSYLDTKPVSGDNMNGFIQVPLNAKYMKFASANTIGSATDYTKATVTGELPLRSLPNGVCDTLNLVTGEYVQRVGEVVLNGSEVWQLATDNTFPDHIRFQSSRLMKLMKKDNAYIHSYEFPNARKGYKNTEEFIKIGDGQNDYFYLNIKREKLQTQDINGFKQYLSQNPVTVQYELATPIVRKLGFTAKGNYTQSNLATDCKWGASPTSHNNTLTTRYKTTSAASLPIVYNAHLFSNDFPVRYFNVDAHQDCEYISNMEYGQYVNVRRDKLEADTIEAFSKWIQQNPIEIGYITWKQSSESYSNIHKPIFFNNVNVQFLPRNLDIQPQLTYQARTRNSYVLDMAKSNTLYTVKAFSNPHDFYIDGKSFGKGTNGCITTPTLTNKLLVTGSSDVKELMIIEGDVTGKNLPYFKGILSSYHDVDEIEVYSGTKNLFDINEVFAQKTLTKPIIENIGVNEYKITKKPIDFSLDGGYDYGQVFSVDVKKGETISFSGYGKGFVNARIFKDYDYFESVSSYQFKDLENYEYFNIQRTATQDCVFCCRFWMDTTNSDASAYVKNIQVEKSSSATSYIPHSHNTTLIEMPTRLETVKVVRPELIEGALEITNGAECASTTEWRSNFIPVQPKEFIKVRNGSADRLAHIDFYDVNKNFIGYSGVVNVTYVPHNCYFIRFFMSKSNCSDLTITRQAYKPIQLNSLPNGVCDEIIMKPNSNKAQLVQRVGKMILDSNAPYYSYSINSNDYCQWYTDLPNAFAAYVFSDTLPTFTERTGILGRGISGKGGTGYYVWFNIESAIATAEPVLKAYLQQNPITVYYELATPIIHEIQLKGYPHVYEDGTVTLNTDIPHKTLVSYNVNQEQLISNQNETIIRHDQQIDDLYYYIEMYLEEIYQMELFRMKLELSL